MSLTLKIVLRSLPPSCEHKDVESMLSRVFPAQISSSLPPVGPPPRAFPSLSSPFILPPVHVISWSLLSLDKGKVRTDNSVKLGRASVEIVVAFTSSDLSQQNSDILFDIPHVREECLRHVLARLDAQIPLSVGVNGAIAAAKVPDKDGHLVPVQAIPSPFQRLVTVPSSASKAGGEAVVKDPRDSTIDTDEIYIKWLAIQAEDEKREKARASKGGQMSLKLSLLSTNSGSGAEALSADGLLQQIVGKAEESAIVTFLRQKARINYNAHKSNSGGQPQSSNRRGGGGGGGGGAKGSQPVSGRGAGRQGSARKGAFEENDNQVQRGKGPQRQQSQRQGGQRGSNNGVDNRTTSKTSGNAFVAATGSSNSAAKDGEWVVIRGGNTKGGRGGGGGGGGSGGGGGGGGSTTNSRGGQQQRSTGGSGGGGARGSGSSRRDAQIEPQRR